MNSDYHQDDVERRHNAVDIAVLKEQVAGLTLAMAEMKVANRRDMAEMKEINAKQTEKIDLMLEQMAEARGGISTLLKFGGAAATLGALLAWAADHLPKWLSK